MKTRVFILAAMMLGMSATAAFAQKVKGSDTVLPLAQKEAEVFMKNSSNPAVTVTGGGSGVGIAALTSNNTDIAMSSRKIKIDEKLKIQQQGKTVVEKIIAYDALAVIINPNNKVSKLTREQLEGIFTGKITNWKEVGGDDMKIVVYSRETSSGTYEFFKESVLKNKNYMASVLSMPATGAIVQSVSQTKGAIGYIGVAYLNDQTKAVQVSYDQGATYVAPSYAAAKDKTYPIVRPLYFYYLKDNASVEPFINFVSSKEGQAIVKEIGYIDVE